MRQFFKYFTEDGKSGYVYSLNTAFLFQLYE